jgi:hypothetical protein
VARRLGEEDLLGIVLEKREAWERSLRGASSFIVSLGGAAARKLNLSGYKPRRLQLAESQVCPSAVLLHTFQIPRSHFTTSQGLSDLAGDAFLLARLCLASERRMARCPV